MDLDTFLVTVYCMVDDEYQTKFRALKPVRPGHRPEMSDSEVLTLATIAPWWHDWSERDYLASVGRHWHAYFPRLLSQSAYNRRCRDLGAVLCELSTQGGKELNGRVPAEIVDAVPVPLMRRGRGRCHRLFACEADIGRGGSDHAWYYGVSLLLRVTPQGVITGWVSGPASTEGRWLAESLLRWRTDPPLPAAALADLQNQLPPSHHRPRTGPHGPLRPAQAAGTPVTCLAGDAGFRGAVWQHHWQQAYGATVVTPPTRFAPLPARLRWFSPND